MTPTVNILFTTTLLLLPFLLLHTLPATAQKSPPHIVIIMADDLGFNDLGFRNPQMVTPNIDYLARTGVLLNNSYMLKSCTPSRSSLLTGVYAYRMGLQDSSLNAAANGSLPLDKRLFVQELQEKGYSTHFVGKWHLGFCKPEMTPTYRGFDTFYGKYNGEGDYFTHRSKKNGYDLQDNNGTHFSVDWSSDGNYSTYLFTDKAVDIINNHDNSQPLFLFLSYQAVHGPLQFPPKYLTNECANVTAISYRNDTERQKHCALTVPMDEGIGKVIKALKDTGLDDNLILYFTSDNGGPTAHGSSNWPLRGAKTTEWEGGTRVISILHSKKYLPEAYSWNGMIHAVDWYPTILAMAGIETNNTEIDGINSWDRIVQNQFSRRTEFVYNINEVLDNRALRWMNYKMVNFKRAKKELWYFPPPGENPKPAPTDDHKNNLLLFDIDNDPSEEHNLGNDDSNKCIVEDMVRQLKRKYEKRLVPTPPVTKLDSSDPKNFYGAWSTGWC